MQVASLCDTVEPAWAGSVRSGHMSQDDALELQLFELEQNILLQAQGLANKYRSFFREERWVPKEERSVMSEEDLARFKSANAKLLALQRRKALLDKMAVDLDDDQAVQPLGIMERAEQDFSGQSLGASSGQLAQLAAHPVHWKDIMLVSQNSEHDGVCQCNLHLTSLTNRMCPSLTGALPDLTGNQHGKTLAAQRPPQPPVLVADGNETKNQIDEMNCVLSLQNARTNTQTNTGREWISIPCLHIYCRALNSNFPTVQRVLSINISRRNCESGCGH